MGAVGVHSLPPCVCAVEDGPPASQLCACFCPHTLSYACLPPPAHPLPLLQCQLALKAGKFYTSVTNMCVWGNHSTTQVPDFVNAKIGGRRAPAVIKDDAWLKEEFTPTVGGWWVGVGGGVGPGGTLGGEREGPN